MKRSLQLICTLLLAGSAFAGSASPDFKSNDSFTPVKVMVHFANQIAWGDSTVWGASVLSQVTNAAFATATPLAQRIAEGFSTVWKSGTAWATMTPGQPASRVKGRSSLTGNADSSVR